jgi:hypothetical protein
MSFLYPPNHWWFVNQYATEDEVGGFLYPFHHLADGIAAIWHPSSTLWILGMGGARYSAVGMYEKPMIWDTAPFGGVILGE